MNVQKILWSGSVNSLVMVKLILLTMLMTQTDARNKAIAMAMKPNI